MKKVLSKKPKESFWTIFRDDNEWNEKAIIGFIAFIVMCIVVVIQLVIGILGKDIIINDYVFNAFTVIVLGCFGISGVENVMGKKTKKEEPTEETHCHDTYED